MYNSVYIANTIPAATDNNICNNAQIDKINIKQAINITIACNRNLQKAFLNRVTERYSLDVANYKFKPNISLNMNSNYNESDNSLDKSYSKSANITPKFSILTPIGTNISLDWENFASDPKSVNTFKNASKITIRQPLLKQSGIDLQTASVKNAKDNNKLQILRLSDQIEDEINRTIFLFRQIIQNHNQLSIQESTLNITKKLLNQTKALIKAGRLASYEQIQVESQVASQDVNLEDAKINLKKSYLLLANQLGLNKNQNIKIDQSDNQNPPSLLTKPIDKLFDTVLTNNINYQNILVQKDINQRDYHVAYDQARWTIDLNASYQLQGFDNSFGRSAQKHVRSSNQNISVGVQFDIPLDSNPSRNQALVENKIRAKQIELDKKQIEQEVYTDLQDQLYQHNTLWNKLQLAKKSVKIKQDSFSMAKKKYEAGRLSSFELVRIQDDVESAKITENNNLIAYLNNYTILDKLLNKTFSRWGINVTVD